MRIVLTGIAGRFGRRVANRLNRKHDIIGLDRRPCPGLPRDIVHHRVDLRRRPAENIFRPINFLAENLKQFRLKTFLAGKKIQPTKFSAE